jgi:hypothetical protein
LSDIVRQPGDAPSSGALWPDELFEEQRFELAKRAIPLLLEPSKWINRRVETFELLHETRVRHRVSVDFTLPQRDLPTLVTAGMGFVLVPLALMKKSQPMPNPLATGLLRNFDIRDEDGRALPLVTGRQNGLIASAILISLAEYLIDRAEHAGYLFYQPEAAAPLETSLYNDLIDIATKPSAEAQAALLNISGGTGRRAVLWSERAFRIFARGLAPNFILLTPIVAQSGERRVLKFAYETRSRPLHLTILQRLRLQPVAVGAVILGAGLAGSYHLEFEAPEGLLIKSAGLTDLRTREVLSRENAIVRTHLYASGRPGVTPVLFDASLVVQSYLVFETLAASAAISAVLWIGIALHDRGVHPSRDAVTALIVVLPVLFVTFLARPAHPITARLVSGLRGAIALSMACSLAAGASLAVTLSGPQRLVIWESVGTLSAIVTALSAVAWIVALVAERA